MTCPKCNHENDADARFCENCGAQLLPANDKKKTKPFVKVLLALALPIVWIVPFVPAYISATGTDLGRTASCFITVLVIAIAIYLCLAIIKKITAQKQAKGKLWFISAAIFLFTGIYVLRMPQCRYDAYWGIPGSDLRVVYNDSKAGLIEGGWWQKERLSVGRGRETRLGKSGRWLLPGKMLLQKTVAIKNPKQLCPAVLIPEVMDVLPGL